MSMFPVFQNQFLFLLSESLTVNPTILAKLFLVDEDYAENFRQFCTSHEYEHTMVLRDYEHFRPHLTFVQNRKKRTKYKILLIQTKTKLICMTRI